jgi:GDPmannose 4,6-dehydratase
VLSLGNLNATRDWGHAKDYVRGMWQMLQTDKPTDYVLSTNEQKTVRSFVEQAFRCVSIEVVWDGIGLNEKGYHKQNGDLLVDVSPAYFRPTEVEFLLGDNSRATTELGWKREYSFDDLVSEMVEADIELLER